jgi:uncharacterized membrane protein
MYAPPTQYVPQIGSVRRALIMWFIVAAGSIVVMSLIIGAPVALKAGHPVWSEMIYRVFSYLCHQIPERSFFIAEHQFAVCARCTGLYAGFTLATVIYPLLRSLRQIEAPPRKWLFIAASPLAIDFTIGFLGIWDNTHFSRFATGALLGAAAVFYVMPGLVDLSLREWHPTREPAEPQTGNKLPNVKIFSTGAGAAPSDYSAPERRI